MFTGQLQTKFLEVEAGQQQLRFQEAEALKTELRELVVRVDASFATLEAAIGNLEARRPAPVAAAGRDPWWSSTGRARFELSAEDSASDEQTRAGAGPPGFSERAQQSQD